MDAQAHENDLQLTHPPRNICDEKNILANLLQDSKKRDQVSLLTICVCLYV